MLFRFYHPESPLIHYLFGTIHLRSDAAFSHANKAEKYIGKVATYCAEMDLNNDNIDLLPHMMLKEGATNAKHWGERKFAKYRKLCKKSYNIDLNHFDHMTPFYIHNILTECIVGKVERDPLDLYLWKYAMENHKNMVGLESLEDQINIMATIPLPFQYKMLQSTFKNTKSYYRKVHKLINLYRESRLKALYKSTKKSMGSLRSLMIYDRNNRMSERIQTLAQSESVFISVGAAHLPGKSGIIAQLKRAGYKFDAL